MNNKTSEGKYKKNLLIILVVATVLNLFFAWKENSKTNLIVGITCLLITVITIIQNRIKKKE